jgi:MFS family permease
VNSLILNPTVLKLGFVSFFADVASEMLYVVTPLFVTGVLGASMLQMGLIEGCAEALASLLKAYSGVWSDARQSRKPFVVFGYGLAAIAKPFIGLSTSWVHVFLARSTDRFGKGVRGAPRDAMIAESVAKENLGAAFGWHRGMDTLGAALGPLVTLMLLTVFNTPMRDIFLWAVIPGLCSTALVLSLKEKKQDSVAAANKKNKILNPFLAWKKTSSGFKSFSGVWFLFAIANSSDMFLALKATSAGVDVKTLILMFCVSNLVYALASPALGAWSDRFSRVSILSAGLVIFSLVYVGFAFAVDAWQFWFLFLVYGLYQAATEGVSKALVVQMSDDTSKASVLGISSAITGVGTLLSSLFAGFIWDHWGAATTFTLSAAVSLVAAMLLLAQRRTHAL